MNPDRNLESNDENSLAEQGEGATRRDFIKGIAVAGIATGVLLTTAEEKAQAVALPVNALPGSPRPWQAGASVYSGTLNLASGNAQFVGFKHTALKVANLSFLVISLMFLAFANLTANAGTYRVTYSGGNISVTNSYTTGYSLIGDQYGAAVYNNPGVNCTGDVTASFVWVPQYGMNPSSDPAPLQAIVQGDVTVQAYNDSAVLGTVDDGMGDDVVNTGNSVTSTGTHFVLKQGTQPLNTFSVTISCFAKSNVIFPPAPPNIIAGASVKLTMKVVSKPPAFGLFHGDVESGNSTSHHGKYFKDRSIKLGYRPLIPGGYFGVGEAWFFSDPSATQVAQIILGSPEYPQSFIISGHGEDNSDGNISLLKGDHSKSAGVAAMGSQVYLVDTNATYNEASRHLSNQNCVILEAKYPNPDPQNLPHMKIKLILMCGCGFGEMGSSNGLEKKFIQLGVQSVIGCGQNSQSSQTTSLFIDGYSDSTTTFKGFYERLKDGMMTHDAANAASAAVQKFVDDHKNGGLSPYTDISIQTLGGNIAIP